MGVKGLWKLLESTGQPVTLESLEGKVLAIDISLWLNMALKGMRDLHGHSANDAHLITLFNRICKLLYFGVKPVFVFDGKAPLLKQKTLYERRQQRQTHVEHGRVASKKLLQNFLKRQVLNTVGKEKKDNKYSVSGEKDSGLPGIIEELKKNNRNEEDDLYVLPESPAKPYHMDSSDEEKEEQWYKRSTTREAVYGSAMAGDFKQMMSIDINSCDFNALPTDIQHELLNDIKEIRKRRRTQIESMPEKTETFSNYQLDGLLAKHALSNRIEQMEKKMQEDNAMSMSVLNYDQEISSVKANRLISDEKTHYILISKLAKNSLEKKKKLDLDTEVSYFSSLVSSSNQTQQKESEIGSSNPTSTTNFQTNDTPTIQEISNSSINYKLSDVTGSENLLTQRVQPVLSSPTQVKETTPSSSLIQDTDLTLNNENPFSVTDRNNTSSAPVRNIPPEFERVECNSQSKFVSNQDIVNKTAPVINAVEGGIHNDVELSLASQKSSSTVILQSEASLSEASENRHVASDDDEIEEFIEVKPSEIVVTKDANAKELSQEDLDVDSEHSDFFEANPWLDMEGKDFDVLTEQLEVEDKSLIEKIKSSARAARDVSDRVTTESQHLLKLFGIPYVISPQEAESQCAYLDTIGLTVGTITDDSDVWLFGGRVVYKDVFGKNRNPTAYSINDIKSELGLERHHLINIALCSGSDYTTGIDGVGPVKALEIMKEFPGEGIESLKGFKKWWDAAHEQVKHVSHETKMKTTLRKLSLPATFPSDLVVDAYLNPTVCASKETFSWGMPDLSSIRDFLIERLNWTKKKVDESLLPVLKRASERNSRQVQLTNYFPRISATQKNRKKSKRVMRAITGISQRLDNSETAIRSSNTKGKRKRKLKVEGDSGPSKPVSPKKETLCLSESSSSD